MPTKAKREQGHQGAFIFGAVVGAIAGAAAALFMTPRSGPEIRQQLAARGSELQQREGGMASDLRSQSQSVVGPYVEKVSDVAQKGAQTTAAVAGSATQRMQQMTGKASSDVEQAIEEQGQGRVPVQPRLATDDDQPTNASIGTGPDPVG
jgi:gas vesicle protein